MRNFSFTITLKQIRTFVFDTMNSVLPVSAIFQKNNCRPGPLSACYPEIFGRWSYERNWEKCKHHHLANVQEAFPMQLGSIWCSELRGRVQGQHPGTFRCKLFKTWIPSGILPLWKIPWKIVDWQKTIIFESGSI